MATAVGGVLVRCCKPCVMSPPWLQVPPLLLRVLLPWVQMPNKVLSLLLRQIPSRVTMAVGGFAAVNRDGISETGPADGFALYIQMLEWESAAEVSDDITDFQCNGRDMEGTGITSHVV